MSFTKSFLNSISSICSLFDYNKIDNLVFELVKIKKKSGRIFFLGVGGSAGNCSHAVNDFSKLCEIECYTPTDNVCEITARTNDPDPLAIHTQGRTSTSTYVELKEGQEGKIYTVTVQVTTTMGLIDRRNFRVKVLARSA
jgi:hypothetical protein